MVPSDMALATFYRLLIVIMSLSAAVWPQFPMKSFKLYVAACISETVTDMAKVSVDQ